MYSFVIIIQARKDDVSHIRYSYICSTNWSKESKELMYNGKINRNVIIENYSDNIEKMYSKVH